MAPLKDMPWNQKKLADAVEEYLTQNQQKHEDLLEKCQANAPASEESIVINYAFEPRPHGILS